MVIIRNHHFPKDAPTYSHATRSHNQDLSVEHMSDIQINDGLKPHIQRDYQPARPTANKIYETKIIIR
jgi:hypothetical protein